MSTAAPTGVSRDGFASHGSPTRLLQPIYRHHQLTFPPFTRGLLTMGQWVVFLLGLAGLLGGGYFAVQHAQEKYLLDVGVFQDAGSALVHGQPLYSDAFPTRSGFRFIYPPFAALPFVPLQWIQEKHMQVAWTLLTIAAVWVIMAMVCRRVGLRNWVLWSIGLAGFAINIEPVRTHLIYGQINAFLILLVTADALGYVPRKLRGVGVGIATGIKITPAAYALVFLARKDWWSVARSAGFFFLTAAIGALVRPAESLYYWTDEFFKSDRGGPPSYPPNQALSGLLTRAGLSDHVVGLIMVPGFILIAAAVLWGAWKLEKSGHRVVSLLLVVLGVCLANPIAVTHHWTGIVLVFPLLAALAVGTERLPQRRVLAAVIVVFLAANLFGPHYVYPHAEHYTFHLQQWLVGNAQGLSGFLLFLVLLVVAARCTASVVAMTAKNANEAKEMQSSGAAQEQRAVIFPDADLSPDKPHFQRLFLQQEALLGVDANPAAFAALTEIGDYRFLDPRGKVGLQVTLFTDGQSTVQVPLAYCEADQEGAERPGFLGEMSHSELGQRHIFDARQRPEFAEAIRALITSAGRGPVSQSAEDGSVIQPKVQVQGTGTPSGDGSAEVEFPLVVDPRASDSAAQAAAEEPGLLLGTWQQPSPTAAAPEADTVRGESVTAILAQLR